MSNNITKNLRLSMESVDKVERLRKIENRSFNNMVETILMRELGMIPNPYK